MPLKKHFLHIIEFDRLRADGRLESDTIYAVYEDAGDVTYGITEDGIIQHWYASQAELLEAHKEKA